MPKNVSNKIKKVHDMYNHNFFKFTYQCEMHHLFQYKDGLNVDIIPFDKYGSCCKGGLYFTTADQLYKFHSDSYSWVRKVSIPLNESQFIKDPEGDKWRSHSLYCEPRKSLKKSSTWMWLIDQGYPISNAIIDANYSDVDQSFYKLIADKIKISDYTNINKLFLQLSDINSIDTITYILNKFKYFSIDNVNDVISGFSSTSKRLKVIKSHFNLR